VTTCQLSPRCQQLMLNTALHEISAT
jgi:hypothetical protein